MAPTVTEVPFGGLNGSLPITGNHALRSNWANSFAMPSDPDVQYVLYCSPGIVTVSGAGGTNNVSYGPPGFGASSAILAGGQYAGIATAVQQVYIDLNGLVQVLPVASTSVAFPAGSIALCYLLLDEVGRIQTISDQRPMGTLMSVPTYAAGATESISSPSLRAGYVSSFYVPRTSSLTPLIPFDVALPAPGFFLGSGAVVISGITKTIPKTYFSTATNAAGDGWSLLTVNAVNQIYVSATGVLTTVIPPTPGTFPANTLPIAEVTTDATGLIRQISDLRNSYI